MEQHFHASVASIHNKEIESIFMCIIQHPKIFSCIHKKWRMGNNF